MIPQILVPIAIAYSATGITVVVPTTKQGATVTSVSAEVDLACAVCPAGVAATAASTSSSAQILSIKN